MMRMALYFGGLPLKTHNHLIMRKIPHKLKLRVAYKIPDHCSQTFQVTKNKILRKMSQHRGA